MADKRITDLPLILSGDVSPLDVLPIVDVELDITNKIGVDQLKSYINSGLTDTYVTGGTYDNNSGTATFTNNSGGTFNVIGFYTGQTSYVNSLTTGVGLSGDTTMGNITLINTNPDQIVTLSGGSNVEIIGSYPNFGVSITGLTDNNRYTTGFTYSNNTFTISDNSGNTFNTTINSMTGLTVNGVLSATTISGGTFYGDGSGLSGVGGPIIYSAGTGTFSTYRVGSSNVSLGDYSLVAGGCQNTTSCCFSTIIGGSCNTTANGRYSNIFGGLCNTVNICFCNSNILGGLYNIIAGNASSSGILGGNVNFITGSSYTTIVGGLGNTSLSCRSTIGGGICNTLLGTGPMSLIGGGCFNTNSSTMSSIVGGVRNVLTGNCSFIGGGSGNTSNCVYSFIGGGTSNTVNNTYGGILGGCNNKVVNDCSFIIGNGITSTAANTTHMNCLHLSSLPTSSVGLAPGTVWNNGGVLNIV